MGSIAELPRGDSPSLVLVHPTDAEKLMQFKLNGAEWRGALSLPAYLRREEVLSQQPLTRDGGISYWILIDTALDGNPLDPSSNTRLPLASCETYRKKALVWQDGKLQEVICHGVGSVFCASHLRKRGYAQRIMQELAKELRTYQTTSETPCLFSILFSDIGKKFYNTFGWEPFSSSHISLPGQLSAKIHLPKAQPLYTEDLASLCETDVALVKKSLKSRAKGSNTAVAMPPDVDTIQWHHAREDLVGMELHGRTPKIKGAIIGAEGKRVWCYWTRMWYNSNPTDAKGNTLHILRLVVEDDSWEQSASRQTNGNSNDHSYDVSIAALMAFAQTEAEEWKMEHVEIWNPSGATVSAARRLDPSAKVTVRDTESIASLQWFPEHDGPVAEKIDWIANEKYGWC